MSSISAEISSAEISSPGISSSVASFRSVVSPPAVASVSTTIYASGPASAGSFKPSVTGAASASATVVLSSGVDALKKAAGSLVALLGVIAALAAF